MKLCILNSSGNVGKSTVSREVFAPRLKNALTVVEIESQNSSNSAFNMNTVKYAGDTSFETLYEYLCDDNDTIFDIGASEIANFFTNAAEYSGAIDMFDLFVIPSMPNAKIMEDTIKTILFLRSQEIDDSKIKIIFNGVTKTVEEEFAAMLKFSFAFDTNLFIKKSGFITDLALLKTTFLEVYNPDKRHYKDLLKEATDPQEKRKLLKRDLLNMGAEKKIKELDYLFSEITGVEVDSLAAFSFSPAPLKASPKPATKKQTQPDEDGVSEDDEEL